MRSVSVLEASMVSIPLITIRRFLLDPRGGCRSKTGPSPTDRARPGSKHHLITEAQGIPLAVIPTTTRDQSIRSAWRSLASRTSCSRSQTPAVCQSRRRRQQLMPLPQLVSRGSRSHRRHVCRINSMPVRTARSSSGLRPGYRERRGLGVGSKGSMSAHNSSSSIGLAMCFCHRNNDEVKDHLRQHTRRTSPSRHAIHPGTSASTKASAPTPPSPTMCRST